MTEIGTKIKALREFRGISQGCLAKRIGVSTAHISNIETGKKSPTIRMIEKISSGLGAKANVNFSLIFESQ